MNNQGKNLCNLGATQVVDNLGDVTWVTQVTDQSSRPMALRLVSAWTQKWVLENMGDLRVCHGL